MVILKLLIFFFLYNQSCWLNKIFWSKFVSYFVFFLSCFSYLKSFTSSQQPPKSYLSLRLSQTASMSVNAIEFNRPPNFQKVPHLASLHSSSAKGICNLLLVTLTHTHSHKHTILKALWETGSGILKPQEPSLSSNWNFLWAWFGFNPNWASPQNIP